MAEFKDVADQLRDIAEVPAVEVITTTAVHLMSAAAVQCGLGEDGAKGDLDEARKLITALAAAQGKGLLKPVEFIMANRANPRRTFDPDQLQAEAAHAEPASRPPEALQKTT